MEEVTVTMRLKKQTKRTVRYEAEKGQPEAITTLYIQKWAFPKKGESILAPEFIAVTVKEVD